jgi:predicted phosphodiesterase
MENDLYLNTLEPEELFSLGFKRCSWGSHPTPLALEEFNRDPSKKDGLKSYCRQCQAIQRRNAQSRQSDRMNDDYSLDIGVNAIPLPELWGEGLARLVAPSTTESFETVVFVSDIHAPYHDPQIISATLQLVNDIKPHRVVINGDTNDFFQLSRFNKALERLDNLQAELDIGFEIRRAFRSAAPDAIMDETVGNHDERLLTYVSFQAQALRSLQALKPQNLLRLDELDINFHPRNGFRLREEFLVEHGQIVRKDAGASAKARLNDTLISGIMGHTHRMGTAYRSGYKDLKWYEQGCLCMRNADYVIGETNWQPGIAVGQFSTKTRNFHVELVPAVGQGLLFGGRRYGDTEAEPNIYGAAVPALHIESIPLYGDQPVRVNA